MEHDQEEVSTSTNILKFPDIYQYNETTESIAVEKVFEGIQANNVDTVIVLGYTKNGEEYFASSISDGGTILWLIERLKKRLLEFPDE